MPNITIDQSGCRSCNLCVEICPTDVLTMDSSEDYATVAKQDDCIGCTSCLYICPSRCIDITDYNAQRPFYRIERNQALISKFLQKTPAAAALTEEDYDEALWDVSTRLLTLVDSMTQTMGRGQKVLGRKSGQISAAHLPELYEAATIDQILERLKHTFEHAFSFTYNVSGEGEVISMEFHECALHSVVKRSQGKSGEAAVCNVFHDYLAGLFTSFTRKRYSIAADVAGSKCSLKFDAS